MKNILDITKGLGIPDSFVIPYGWDKAKIDLKYKEELKNKKDGKYVLITSAMNANAAGEGKTSTEIGLNDALRRLGVNSIACLREPSQGVSYGNKGPAHGALKARVIPDAIDYHFTSDIHALTYTINSIAAQIDNIIYQGNELNIDPDRIVWRRALDVNDRALRSVTVAQDDKKATPHHDEFVITVASELMTILTISQSEQEFMDRVNKILVAYTKDGEPVYFGAFNCSKAILKMMKTAMNPNVVQTLEENPVLVHCGPFANISIGVNSINATKLAMKLAPVVVTEAGFGGDLGAEKFLDIKCQLAGIHPNTIVLVATARALKLHGGVKFEDLEKENCEAIKAGICNLEKHYNNMKLYGVPVVVAINRFPSDTEAELKVIGDWCNEHHAIWSINSAAIDGSIGSVNLAQSVKTILDLQEAGNTELADNYKPLYDINGDWSIDDKIGYICRQIYGADGVEYSDLAIEQMQQYKEMGYGKFPICISKTPNSLTDDPKILGAPIGFKIHIREIRLYAGAELLVPLSGALLLMPGLPKEPRCLDKFN